MNTLVFQVRKGGLTVATSVTQVDTARNRNYSLLSYPVENNSKQGEKKHCNTAREMDGILPRDGGVLETPAQTAQL